MESRAFIQAEAERLIATQSEAAPAVLFLSGPQGSGKTTIANQLRSQLDDSVCLSLDDFYLSRSERRVLAEQVHPLFATRGPPGTHHVEQLIQTLTDLKSAAFDAPISVPIFDKRTDDILPKSDWRQITTRPKLIIVEGWLLGVAPDPDAPHSDPINDVEAEDTHGAWRRHQETLLATLYQELWDCADAFVYLDTETFSNVYAWRQQQEEQTLGLDPGTLPPERRVWLKRFIGHYERLTKRLLAGQRRPGTAIKLNALREVVSITPMD